MVSKLAVVSVLVGMSLLLVACQPGGPLRQIEKGDELAFYNFTEPNSFEQGAYGAATLRVSDGIYRIDVLQGDNTLWWGQWGDTYSDVVIDVDVEQIDERIENAYGVMCRVRGTVGQPSPVDAELAAIMAEATDEAGAELEVTAEATASVDAPALNSSEGDGYLFLIQGGGAYAIMRARGRDLTPLVDWSTSDAIQTGPARNHLRAVCAGDYLAFYINERLVAEATDDAYREGQVGLAASAATRLGTRIQFDNLTVSEARSS